MAGELDEGTILRVERRGRGGEEGDWEDGGRGGD